MSRRRLARRRKLKVLAIELQIEETPLRRNFPGVYGW
jgi:hypothetical protein